MCWVDENTINICILHSTTITGNLSLLFWVGNSKCILVFRVWRGGFFFFFLLFFKLMGHALDLHTNYKMRCTLGALSFWSAEMLKLTANFWGMALVFVQTGRRSHIWFPPLFFSSRLVFYLSLAPTQFLVIVIPVLFFQYFFYLFFNFELLFLYYYYYYYFVICRIIHSKHQTTFTGNCSQMTTVTRNCRFMCWVDENTIHICIVHSTTITGNLSLLFWVGNPICILAFLIWYDTC